MENVDVLDQLRDVEKAVKTQLFLQSVEDVKRLSRKVFELKEEIGVLLQETGNSSDDCKRIIDYVNELPEVKLNEDDKKTIKDKVILSVRNRKNMEKNRINTSFVATGTTTVSFVDRPISFG